MVWNTRNYEQDDEPVSEVVVAPIVDDEDWDDVQLSRMGIGGETRDWVEPPPEPIPPPPRQRQTATGINDLMRAWTTAINENGDMAVPDTFRAAMESVYNADTGSFEFGDEPIDPEAHPVWDTAEDVEDDTCPECGLGYEWCDCGDEYYEPYPDEDEYEDD